MKVRGRPLGGICAALISVLAFGGCQNAVPSGGIPVSQSTPGGINGGNGGNSVNGANGQTANPAEAGDITPARPSQETQPSQIRFGAPRGAAALALTQFFMGDTGEGTFDGIPFSLELAGAPDQITAKLATGELDAALLPVNLASVLYNRTDGDIRLAAITGMGLFYAVANNALRGDGPELTEFAQLDGAKVVSFGLGATPQYVIEYLAQDNGIKLDITFTAEAPEAVAQLLAGQANFGILPEPFVTSLLTQNPDFDVVVSLADAWEQATNSPLVTTALVFRADFLATYPQTVHYLIAAVDSSISWVNAHPADAAVIVAEQMILPTAEIAEAAIPRTNLVMLTGAAARTATLDFLTVLYQANPVAIGGSIPDDDFFIE